MDLKKLNDNVKTITDKLARYEDSEGNISVFPVGGLICRCEYLRVDDNNKKMLEFQNEIPKNMTFTKIKITTQVTKDTITNKEEDKLTLVDKEVEVYEMWRVSNGLGMKEIFNSKKEATNYCNEINERYMEFV